ncbi:hypothetical protein QF042_003962 [Pedobacter sp. W3I1]|nr:hypothetical protein [Pedobacter sp. W3I1]
MVGPCVRDGKGSVPILHRYRSEAQPCKSPTLFRISPIVWTHLLLILYLFFSTRSEGDRHAEFISASFLLLKGSHFAKKKLIKRKH